MNKKLLLITLMFLIVVPIVFASDFYFKRGDDIRLQIPCFDNNNTFCPVSTMCTMTVNNPAGNNIVNNVTMTYSDTYYNYTIMRDDITINGEHTAIINCVGAEDNDYAIFTFEVNMGGKEATDNPASMAIAIFIIIITIGVFLLPKIVNRFFENEILNMTIKYSCILIGFFLLSLDATIMITLADNFGVGITSEMFMFWWIINKTAYFAMFIVIIRYIFMTINNFSEAGKRKRMGYD